MRPELSILSFLCTVLLVGLAYLHAKSRNVAVLAFISWLLVCNVIQGVNSVVWSADAIVRLEVWCDISSRLLLGSRLALPAACTCICAHLHFLSSRRNTKLRSHRMLLEFISCVIVPFIYMALHTIVQDHRFVLAADFGCVSSVLVSIPALILVWIPPLIPCISSVIFAILALWRHAHRNRLVSNRAGLSSRLITVTFLRPLFTSMFTSCLILCIGIFDICAAVLAQKGFQPWTGLARTHADISRVYVVSPSEHLYLARIEAFWWVVPASTLAFSLMASAGLLFCATQDTPTGFRSAGKWFRSTILRQAGEKDTFIQSSREMSKRFTLIPPTPPLPVHLSGWDDTFRSSRSSKSKPTLPPITCDIPLTPTSPSDSECESESSLKAVSLAYLQSPTGRDALRPPLARASSQSTPRWSALLATPPPALTSSFSSSPTNSILASPWPRPPSTVPISVRRSRAPSPSSPEPHIPASAPAIPPPTHAHRHARPPSTSSLTGSISSSIISAGAGAYLADPDIFLHSVGSPPRRAPFQDAGIPPGPRRVSSKDSLQPTRNLSLSMKRSGGLGRKKEAYGDAIYMTVVQETQAV